TKDKDKIVDALSGGQLVFSIALGDLVRELNGKVQKFVVKKEKVVKINGGELTIQLESDPEGFGFIAKCLALDVEKVCTGETEEQVLELMKETLLKEVSDKAKDMAS
ncbi:MAG: hypothetical protein GY800_00620, partial [Planctomycetes bacterium]|nr:hypothetical protein [Planctomycetota bacterium]